MKEKRTEKSGGERKTLLDTCARKGRMRGIREKKREMKKKKSQEDTGRERRGKGERDSHGESEGKGHRELGKKKGGEDKR